MAQRLPYIFQYLIRLGLSDMLTSFNDFTVRHRPKVDKELAAIFSTAKHQVFPVKGSQYDLVDDIAKLVARGGKRTRPLLLILAAEGYGAPVDKRLYAAAASQELLHTYFLIHDDIIDQDLMRWGGPNIIANYLQRDDSHGAQHRAEAYALLAGDICASLATEAWLASGYPSSRVTRALHMQHGTLLSVIGGELSDSLVPTSTEWPQEDAIIAMYRQKTASYSFVLPLQLGAMIANADESELQAIAAVGEAAGIAYQFQDDLLGIFGASHHTGKPVLNDLREGKRTLLVRIAMDSMSALERQEFLEHFGKSDAPHQALERCRSLIQSSGARAIIEARSSEFVQQATALLEQLSMNGRQQIILKNCLEQLLGRNR